MKVAPVSADLLVKLAVAGLAVLSVWYMTRQVKQAVGDAVDSVFDIMGSTWETVRPDAVIQAVESVADYLTTPDQTHRENGQYVLSKDR